MIFDKWDLPDTQREIITELEKAGGYFPALNRLAYLFEQYFLEQIEIQRKQNESINNNDNKNK
jgi:hypothetical protein